MTRWRRWRTRGGVVTLAIGAIFGICAAVLAGHLGWFARTSRWQAATGWEQIPTARRGTASVAGIQWLGHAGFVIELDGVRVVVDPNLSDRCSVAPRRWPAPVAADALGPIDVVVLSHAHRDHLDVATLAALRQVGQVIVPKGAEQWLPSNLQALATTVVPGDQTSVVGIRITALSAAHNGHRHHPFGSEIPACSYLFEGALQTIYWAGDSGMGPHFAAIGRRYHPDLALLPIGAFRPRWPLAKYHLSPEEAVVAARQLGVARVVPTHFGTFALSLDQADEALPRFAAAADAAGLAWAMPPIFELSTTNAATAVAATSKKE